MDGLTLGAAEELVEYWQVHPPAHVVLRGIGEYLGAWEGPAVRRAPQHLATEAEVMAGLEAFNRAVQH